MAISGQVQFDQREVAIRNNNRITSVHSVNNIADQLKHQKDLFYIIAVKGVDVIAESIT